MISPHYDDVIGACAGIIMRDKKLVTTTILTVFSDLELWNISEFAYHLHNDVWKDVSMGTRKEENILACRCVDAMYEDMHYLDAIYRKDNDGWLYPHDGDIFKGLHMSDKQIMESIKSKLIKMIEDYDEVFFPLGLGGHVDHVIMSKIGLDFCELNSSIFFYKDFSYEESTTDTQDLFLTKKVYLSKEEQMAKEEAVSKYNTQINMLFGCKEKIRGFYEKYYKDENGFYEIYFERKK